ncbi:MAG: 6-phosphogluconolactonase, partial [Silvibacterium sp.]
MAKKLKIEYNVEPDAAALAVRAAEQFTRAVEKAAAERGRARIAISGGSTPKATFQLLADAAQPWRERMPWEKLEIFWVDERCVPPDHPDSNYRMTREALLDKVPMKPEQVHRME